MKHKAYSFVLQNGWVAYLIEGLLVPNDYFIFNNKVMELPRAFGPKKEGHPSIGELCPACKEPFKAGDYTSLVGLGPGSDPEEQERARAGRAYNAIAIEVHYACATGYTQPPN